MRATLQRPVNQARPDGLPSFIVQEKVHCPRRYDQQHQEASVAQQDYLVADGVHGEVDLQDVLIAKPEAAQQLAQMAMKVGLLPQAPTKCRCVRGCCSRYQYHEVAAALRAAARSRRAGGIKTFLLFLAPVQSGDMGVAEDGFAATGRVEMDFEVHVVAEGLVAVRPVPFDQQASRAGDFSRNPSAADTKLICTQEQVVAFGGAASAFALAHRNLLIATGPVYGEFREMSTGRANPAKLRRGLQQGRGQQ